jgi:uncharacterized protein YqjF (DUF2071 family)
MISLRPSLITEHHSVSSLNDPAREASPAQGISAQLAMWTRPAPWDVTFTSRWRQRSERNKPRSYFADASVDVTDARKTRSATLRSEVRKGCGIATGSPRYWFPCDPPPSPFTES